jgi:hypothetical protein
MNSTCKFLTSMLILSIVLITGCKKDDGNSDCEISPTYNGSVKTIIDNSCAISGCHINGGLVPGNFLSYQGLSGVTMNGKFRNRVLVVKDMPLTGQLSEADFEILKCWADNGFPLQ